MLYVKAEMQLCLVICALSFVFETRVSGMYHHHTLLSFILLNDTRKRTGKSSMCVDVVLNQCLTI